MFLPKYDRTFNNSCFEISSYHPAADTSQKPIITVWPNFVIFFDISDFFFQKTPQFSSIIQRAFLLWFRFQNESNAE